MTDSRRPYGAPQPEDIDDTEDRMGSVEPLDFEDNEIHENISDLFTEDERNRHMAGEPVNNVSLSGAALPGRESNADDLDPEMLTPEDGSRDAKEANESPNRPADKDLDVVGGDEIGAGTGLDEAELADLDPVGRKPQ